MSEQNGNDRNKSVGAVLLERVDNLLTILAGEPKHAVLDSAFLAVREAMNRMMGTPAQETGSFTTEGERLVVPRQEPANPTEPWDKPRPKPVPASQLDENGDAKEQPAPKPEPAPEPELKPIPNPAPKPERPPVHVPIPANDNNQEAQDARKVQANEPAPAPAPAPSTE